ncbi:MAG TPA: amidohydrolase family protein, partial [Thermoanaerobaculia bacterium]|nr:amidohydrolase family protein [Thermoanaerobaculia bacterium]
MSGWIGPETRVLDLGRKMVLPGFHDSHVHLAAGGVELQECALGELSTSDELVVAVKACAEQDPERPWVVGNGWPLPAFPGANPHRSLLDAVVPDRPVFLSAADGHSAWVNSRALAIAGVTRATPDPPNGRIERDADGSPSGTLRERAVDLVAEHLPETEDAAVLSGLKKALEMAAGFGITAIQDASVSEKALRAYAALDGKGELTVRTRAALYVDPAKGLVQVRDLVALRERFRGKRLHPEAVKIFADGVIESHTAALL